VSDLLDLAERVWNGEEGAPAFLAPDGSLTEIASGTAFVWSFANVSAFSTSEGLVLVDTGSHFLARAVHGAIRGWSGGRVHTAVYSHGHIDHVFGVPAFEEEGAAVRVVAHEGVPRRFDRYKLTAGYNAWINRRQFGTPDLEWPTEYRYPDETYREAIVLEIGGERFELHHARGETDDHTWTWIPSREVLCPGDLFIWAAPNAGNPQKVQRYPYEWATALREMAALGAEVLLPGHGMPVIGEEHVRTALTETAELLQSLHDQTVALMNEGARLDEILRTVRPPADLIARPYLRPTYDDPEFVVRNVWRLYGGWWDGNPATLKPASDSELARELAALVGGADRLAQRARELAVRGETRLAGHLVELAVQADPGAASVHAVRAEVLERRAQEETSLMAKGIFGWAAKESREHLREE
jgi:alkyl sulfatase BDS1-like metallo-beta-lactamase superfamily hydrolase